MDNFDYQFYNYLYPDLKKNGINTPRKLLQHYLKFGMREKRFPNKIAFLNSKNFKVQIYRENYPDLKHLNNSELEEHYIKIGRLENREAGMLLNQINVPSLKKDVYHNFNLNYTFLHQKIPIELVKTNDNPVFRNNRLVAHLHCYNIDNFEEFYGEYIKNIILYFNVYVTYSIGDKIPTYDLSVLKIQNRGMDIGGKLSLLKYLNHQNIDYSHILFLHSKSDEVKRKQYFSKYVGSLAQINYICSIINFYDLISHDIMLDGDWNKREGYTINKFYYDWYHNLMNFQQITNKNIEGNCLIASKKLLQSIYPDNLINIFFNLLNTPKTFDYNWVKFQYKLHDKEYSKILDLYEKQKYHGNHLCFTNQELIRDYDIIFDDSKLDTQSHFLKDGSLEHLWERLWLNICVNIGGKHKVLKKIYMEPKLDYNFDLGIYQKMNSKDTSPDIDNIYQIQNQVNKNVIYSLRQILEKLPLDFNIFNYIESYALQGQNKYEVLKHILNNPNLSDRKWISTTCKKNTFQTFLHIFPQFHEIPENDKFWGKGFVEWWNVRKTFSLHKEHHPLHPHPDIGYYNLLDIKHRTRWEQYSSEYGFQGLIFCHFWFRHGMILNGPIDAMLKDGKPNLPWFFNWINENWTKRWDGGDNEILLDVKLDHDKCLEHFTKLLRYFKSSNYHCIDNKPVLGIYRPEEIPKFYIETFQKLAKNNGFEGMIFVKTLNNNLPNNFSINSDDFCTYEFQYPPNYSGTLVDARMSSSNFKFQVDPQKIKRINQYKIDKHYWALTQTKPGNKKLMRGIMPCWDNLPRHSSLESDCHIQIGCNSLLFYFALVKQFLKLKEEGGEYLVVNSLNEWAEQCVLEPSIQNQYSYLEALKLAIYTDLDKVNLGLIDYMIKS